MLDLISAILKLILSVAHSRESLKGVNTHPVTSARNSQQWQINTKMGVEAGNHGADEFLHHTGPWAGGSQRILFKR